MRALRLVFAWSFAAAAVACLCEAAAVLPVPVIISQPGSISAGSIKLLLIGLALALAALFSLTAWAILKSWPSAGRWGFAASLAPALLALASLLHRPFNPATPAWIPLVAGLGGLAVFAPRGASAAEGGRRSGPLPGDGTSRLVNQLVLVAGAGGSIGGVRLISIWARAHELPRDFPPFFAFQVMGAILAALAIHEAGHAVAGLAMRMKLIGFVVGPFQWSLTYGKARFLFRGAGLIAFGGQTMVAPATLDNFRNRKAVQVAGGPAASLLAGALALWAIFTAHGQPWERNWEILAIFADITTLVGLLNLVPFGSKSMYSDGAKLYQLLSGGLWSDYHRVLGMVSAIGVTPLRPRDYDIAAIECAIGTIARGRDEIFLRVCAYAHYLDCGETARAAREIERAESICEELAIEPSIERCAVFVFADGLVRRDTTGARRWWRRIESRKTYRFTENLWPARCVLLLSESRWEEAAIALERAERWARQLPATGAAEAERSSILLLRRALEEASVSTSSWR